MLIGTLSNPRRDDWTVRARDSFWFPNQTGHLEILPNLARNIKLDIADIHLKQVCCLGLGIATLSPAS
jgi:hypothetical protein